jgi:threonine/homoserine/homoserine lactone efflux protein
MLWKGFKFGTLLQLSLGPVSLFVFNTANTRGFWAALSIVFAVVLVDGLYIALAGLGLARFLENEKTFNALKLFGGIVLILFGLNMTAGSLGYDLLPKVSLFSASESENLFVQGFLLTASNPMTIIFWSGVLTAQITQERIDKWGLIPFGLGCVAATFVFKTLEAALGLGATRLLPDAAITVVNIAVGLTVVYFGVKMLLKKK